MLGTNTSLDHKVPRSRGGANDITNLQFVYCCREFDVNRMKGNMLEEEFRAAIVVLARKG